MSTGKKILNVFKVILAVLLSIGLTLFLIVTPITFSGLSILKVKSLTKAVSSVDYTQLFDADDIPSGEGDISSEAVEQIMNSPVTEEILELYITDTTNALYGKEELSKFNTDELKKIIDNNLDDVVELVREIEPKLNEVGDKELKEQIKTTLDEHAENLVEMLPPPQELTKELKESNPTVKTVLDILAKTDMIKAIMIAVIVIYVALIFVCRLPGTRGFKWISVNLFIAFGILAIACVGLLLGGAMITGMISSNDMLAEIFGSFTSTFTTGMIIRTCIILVAAIASLVAHIIIKKQIAKKEVALATEVEQIENIEENVQREE